jgi:hypothetical protein
MSQLTYNEAFDPYHTAFRFVRLHVACGISIPIPFDKFRIMDYFLLFPFRLQNMRLLQEDRAWRGISRAYVKRTPYGELPDDNSIFSKMEPFQRAAASGLARSGLISSEAWAQEEVAFTRNDIPQALYQRCEDLNNGMSDMMDVLCRIMRHYPLNGRHGLKDRTGLLEFRYDPV